MSVEEITVSYYLADGTTGLFITYVYKCVCSTPYQFIYTELEFVISTYRKKMIKSITSLKLIASFKEVTHTNLHDKYSTR